MDKLLILFKEKFYKEPIEVGKYIADRLKSVLKIYCVNCKAEEINRLKEFLKGSDIPVETGENLEKILKVENPFLTLLPKPNIPPLVHAFKKPWSEELAENNDEYNSLLVKEGNPSIDNVLFYVDRDNASETYIRTVYKFLSVLGINFKFVTVFDERYFIFLLKKEYPEEEAKELLGKMFEDYINQVREKIKKTLGLEKVEILPLRGEVGKTLPFFAKKHGYNLLVISHAYETKNELIENSETSVAVFKN